MWTACRHLQMLLLLYLLVLLQTGLAEEDSTSREAVAIIYDGETMFLKVGEKRVVFCKGQAKDKIWLDPRGVRLLEGASPKRVHAEHTQVGFALVFEDANLTDNGTWTCSSSDANDSINIFIIDEAKFEGMSDTMDLIENATLILVCRASGVPKPKLMWYKDGQPIGTESNDPRVKVIGEGRVKIDRVQREDSGDYECKALQQISTMYLAAPNFVVSVHVMHVPKMAREKVIEEYVIMNETKVLHCAATGYPPPEYKWSRQQIGRAWTEQANENIVSDPEGTYSELSIEISNQADLQMMYTCTASNKRGTSKVQFHLQLGNKPPILSKVELVGATNESLEFLVECDNCTSPENDAAVSPNPTDLPVTQYRFELLNTTNETVDWESAAAEAIVVTLDRNLTHDTYVVEGLQPDTTYQVRAAAVNVAGLSEFLNLPPALTADARPTALLSWLYPTIIPSLALFRHYVP